MPLQWKRIVTLKCVLHWFCATKMIHFLIVVTCDEKWILFDNLRRSAQWLDHDEVLKHFPKPKLHKKKVMIAVWWSLAEIIHYSFLNSSETITAEKCQEIYKIHQELTRLRSALVDRKVWILLHDNVRSHVAQPMLQKLNQLSLSSLFCIDFAQPNEKLCLTHHIRWIFYQLTTTFLSISIISCRGKHQQSSHC